MLTGYEVWCPALGETREEAMRVNGVSHGDAAELFAAEREFKAEQRVLVAKGDNDPVEMVVEVDLVPMHFARVA